MKKQDLKKLVKECVKSIVNEIDFGPSRYEPRDRLSGEESSLNIPHFPNSIIKTVNLDGKTKFFVYSDSSNVALILGYGDTENNAIENAKTTANYIKQGGVGHTGDLKDEGIKDPYFMGDENPDVNQVVTWVKSRLERETDPVNINALRRVIQIIQAEQT